jgi:hypothetical protein
VRAALVAAAVIGLGPFGVAAQELTYTGGLGYTTGSYIFAERTEAASLSNGLVARWGRLRVQGTMPVIWQSSGVVSTVGAVPIPTGGTSHGAVAGRRQGQRLPLRTGVGGRREALAAISLETASAEDTTAAASSPGVSVADPLLTAGLELYRSSGTLRLLEVGASGKVPVTDLESGVGTGRWDGGVGGTVALSTGPVVAVLDLVYWWYGDLPGLELRNGPSWGAWAGMPLGAGLWGSITVAGTNRILATAEAARTVGVGLARAGPGGTSWSLLVGAGLSETAPDLLLALGWRRSLLRRSRTRSAHRRRMDHGWWRSDCRVAADKSHVWLQHKCRIRGSDLKLISPSRSRG